MQALPETSLFQVEYGRCLSVAAVVFVFVYSGQVCFFVCQTGVFVFCPSQTAVVKLSGRLSWFIWLYIQVQVLTCYYFPK